MVLRDSDVIPVTHAHQIVLNTPYVEERVNVVELVSSFSLLILQRVSYPVLVHVESPLGIESGTQTDKTKQKTKTKSRLWVTKHCTARKANPSRTYHKPTKRFSPEKNKKGCPRNSNITEILKTSFYSSHPKPKTSFYLKTSLYPSDPKPHFTCWDAIVDFCPGALL